MSSDGFVGMEQLIADLGALDRELIPDAALPAVLEVAAQAANAAKAGVRVRSGRHKRSIHVGGHTELTPDFSPSSDDNWYKDVGGFEVSGRRVQVAIGSTLFYARWLEFGGPRNAANPAIRRAVETHAPQLAARLEKALDELASKHNL